MPFSHWLTKFLGVILGLGRNHFMRLLFLIFIFPVLAFAQDAIPAPDLADKIMSWVGFIPLDGGVVGGIAIVVELLLRLVKSDRPRSIIHLVSRVMQAIAALIGRAGDLLDKVLPQKLK